MNRLIILLVLMVSPLTLTAIGVGDEPGNSVTPLRGFSDPAVASVIGTALAQKHCSNREWIPTNQSFGRCLLNLVILPAMEHCYAAAESSQAADPTYGLRFCGEPAKALLCALRNEHGFAPLAASIRIDPDFTCEENQIVGFNPGAIENWNFIIRNQVLPDLESKLKRVTSAEEMQSIIAAADSNPKIVVVPRGAPRQIPVLPVKQRGIGRNLARDGLEDGRRGESRNHSESRSSSARSRQP